MQKVAAFKTSISSEINQDSVLQQNLVLKVLSSKRMLADHVEITEDALNDLLLRIKPLSNHLTFLKSAALMATSYVVFIHCRPKFLVPTISGVMPILYLQKLVKTQHRELNESKLSKFIVSLDNYEAAIKKNKTFLHETQVIKSAASVLKRYDKENSLTTTLITSIKTVINALYNFVKLLESFPLAEKLRPGYEPFEDLQDCELMTMDLEGSVDLKIIKDFFNIFAYVQSQVLLRLSLIILSNLNDAKTIFQNDLQTVGTVVAEETAKISKFLDLINNVSKVQEKIQKQIDKEISLTLPKELREVRSGSIKFSAKILTTAIQCQHLEELIVKFAGDFEHPNNEDVLEILAAMQSIENELSLSLDEHQRIRILFQKYLNLEPAVEKAPQSIVEDIKADKNQLNMKVVTENDVMVQSDDFFFVDGSTVEVEEDPKAGQAESTEEVNSKVAKKYFKPVLVQLRERIEVIGEDMKEREKKVLKAKGIEMEEEVQPAKIQPSVEDEGNSGSDDEQERQRKIKRNRKKFSENREFLEAKQPMNIFGTAGGFPLPKAPAFDEDVLE